MKIITYLIIPIVLISTLNAFELPAQKQFQPESLRSQAAMVIAQHIDPAHSLPNAMAALNHTSVNHPAIAPHIAFALAKRNEKKLYAILKSQVPSTIEIEDFAHYPENVYALGDGNGLYVHQREDTYNDTDGKRRLYPGIAQLIPHPLEHNAPTRFFQVYSNPRGTKYFRDDDRAGSGREDGNNIGICIWDKKTGMRVNDGSVIKTKLRKQYPQLAAGDPYFPDLMLYGLSSDDRIAWTRFVYALNNHHHEGLCAFDVETNDIVKSATGESLEDVSHSGKVCIIRAQNGVKRIITSNNPSEMLSLGRFFLKEMAPQDNYLIGYIEVVPDQSIYLPMALSPANKTCHPLTINGESAGVHTFKALNSDGKLLAAEKENIIYILDMHSPAPHQISHAIPLPAAAQHSTYQLLFSPGSTKLLILRVREPDENTIRYHLKIFDLATKEYVYELAEEEITPTLTDFSDFIFCNGGDYLMLPNEQLFLQPDALLNHLSLQQLLALLTLEHLKSQNAPTEPWLMQLSQQHPYAKIRELVTNRYSLSARGE